MTSPFLLLLGVLVVAGICVQLLVILHYAYVRRAGVDYYDDAEAFEKDVEWQLLHELDDAIEASANDETLLVLEQQRQQTPPLLLSPPRVESPRVMFAQTDPWHDFKANSRAELAQQKAVLPNATHLDHVEQPLYVNPKQFNRILKRRMTRQLMEEYFRSRSTTSSPRLSEQLQNGCMRRPRGPNGRFLTLEEVERMGDGVVVA